MPKRIDDHRLEAFGDPDIADRAYKILESLEALRYYVQAVYGPAAAADVLTTISLDVMSSVVIVTTEPEKYEIVCKDIGKILYKSVVEEKKAREARGKG